MLIGISRAGSAAVTISTFSSGENVAPYAVSFEASVTGDPVGGPTGGQVYDPRLHDLTYVWDFDDASDATPLVSLNMPAAWQDRNKAYGFQAAHVFRNDTGSDKTCNVTCTVYHDGVEIAQATEQVVVRDPATVYTGTRTAVFSNDGGETWAGAPSGAQQLTTEAEIESFFSNLTQTGRLLLKRGQTIDFEINIGSGADQNVRIGAWGSGNRPILNVVPSLYAIRIDNSTPADDFAFYDLDIQGEWDSTTESGDPRCLVVRNSFRIEQSDPTYCWDNVKISGVKQFNPGTLIATENTDAAPNVVCNDMEITDWQDYGIFLSANDEGACRFALVSSKVYQNPNACRGTDKDDLQNQHGPIRIACQENVVLSCLDLFSVNGWSGGLGGRSAVQGPIRLNTTPSANFTHKACLDRISGENGWNMIGNAEGSGVLNRPGNYVFDKIFLHMGVNSRHGVIWNGGGLTIRNLYAYAPDTDILERLDSLVKVSMESGLALPDATYYDEPIRLYNLTFLNEVDRAGQANQTVDTVLTEIDVEFTDVTTENNVHQAPNLNTPITADAPIDNTTPISGFAARYPGVRYSTEKVSVTLGSDVTDGNTYTVSYPTLEDGLATALGQSDFTAPNGHQIIADGTRYFEADGDISVSFGASDITVTNNTGGTLTSGTTIVHNFVRDTFTTDASFANPTNAPVARPTTGSAAIDDGDTGLKAYDDLLEGGRPASGNERGALLQ